MSTIIYDSSEDGPMAMSEKIPEMAYSIVSPDKGLEKEPYFYVSDPTALMRHGMTGRLEEFFIALQRENPEIFSLGDESLSTK